MGVVIRRLTETDWSAFRTIRLRALRTTPEAFSVTLDREPDQPETFWRARLADPLNLMLCGSGEEVMMIREKSGQPPLETPGTTQSPVV